jgi:hypothetical protein
MISERLTPSSRGANKLVWNTGDTFENAGAVMGLGSPVITGYYVKYVKQQGLNVRR